MNALASFIFFAICWNPSLSVDFVFRFKFMSRSNLLFTGELAYLYNAACLCREAENGAERIRQVAPLFASIPFHHNSKKELQQLERELFKTFPELVKFGRLRGKKA